MTAILIVANGAVRQDLLTRLAPRYGFLIGADGGARHLLTAGLTPDLVVGDLDSLKAPYREELLRAGCPLDLHPVAKDATDLELALERAAALKPRAIDILGGWGSRWDHSLINLHLLARFTTPDREVRMLDARHGAQAVVPGARIRLQGAAGDLVSLIPLTPVVRGVNIQGFAYPLKDRDLVFGSSLPVSNQLAGPAGQVSVQEGILLAIQQFRNFKDRSGPPAR
jgi:thiamine pyrophosphokinase